MLMQFGQFLAHDMLETAGQPVDCCQQDIRYQFWHAWDSWATRRLLSTRHQVTVLTAVHLWHAWDSWATCRLLSTRHQVTVRIAAHPRNAKGSQKAYRLLSTSDIRHQTSGNRFESSWCKWDIQKSSQQKIRQFIDRKLWQPVDCYVKKADIYSSYSGSKIRS